MEQGYSLFHANKAPKSGVMTRQQAQTVQVDQATAKLIGAFAAVKAHYTTGPGGSLAAYCALTLNIVRSEPQLRDHVAQVVHVHYHKALAEVQLAANTVAATKRIEHTTPEDSVEEACEGALLALSDWEDIVAVLRDVVREIQQK